MYVYIPVFVYIYIFIYVHIRIHMYIYIHVYFHRNARSHLLVRVDDLVTGPRPLQIRMAYVSQGALLALQTRNGS